MSIDKATVLQGSFGASMTLTGGRCPVKRFSMEKQDGVTRLKIFAQPNKVLLTISPEIVAIVSKSVEHYVIYETDFK